MLGLSSLEQPSLSVEVCQWSGLQSFTVFLLPFPWYLEQPTLNRWGSRNTAVWLSACLAIFLPSLYSQPLPHHLVSAIARSNLYGYMMSTSANLCNCLQSVTYRYREFPVPGIFHFFGGIRKKWYRKKVSEPVSEKFGTGKKSRNRYRKNLVPEKGL